MDRIEIPESHESAGWAEAIARGDEVVITRDGEVVLEVSAPKRRGPAIDRAALARAHALLGNARGGGAELIRQLRDEDRI